uniref:Uncharacterized protein n=1 Tax=virus sp. ct5rm7 TaxID=2827298 RepID=A0A8S5RGR2_9VIRU|nr:MAG TPA: hypothetical protein [virus sp. ct5rm7]
MERLKGALNNHASRRAITPISLTYESRKIYGTG